ncbi:MAG: hypothetical protein IJ218_04285 [Alphaproteobacteria bacterium]|nr:hypothetical protein [Alphaproteobacteria bacterium]
MAKQNKFARMRIGDFMLRNNQCSSEQTKVRAKGVLVDESHYLDIDSILKTPVSKQEALLYGQQLKMKLPTKKQMQQIEKNLEIINNSLLRIGRGDCMLLGEILQQFWTRYEKTTDSVGKRRCVLFLVPI